MSIERKHEDQSRNGVRVHVTRHVEVSWSGVDQVGLTVEADCQCFGSEERVHSREDCPVRLAILARA